MSLKFLAGVGRCHKKFQQVLAPSMVQTVLTSLKHRKDAHTGLPGLPAGAVCVHWSGSSLILNFARIRD